MGSVIGAITGSNKAIKAQTAAANAATDVQERMYNQSREDLEPFRQAGLSSNNELLRLLGLSGDSSSQGYGSLAKGFALGDYIADPGYQFRQDQQQKGLDRAASARGNFYSGEALKDAAKYSGNLASEEYGNAYNRYNQDQNNLYNRLAGITNTGTNATNTGVQSNQVNASNIGSIYGNLSNAQGAAATSNANGLFGLLGLGAGVGTSLYANRNK